MLGSNDKMPRPAVTPRQVVFCLPEIKKHPAGFAGII
jgi:hypothetical protein